MYMIDNSRTKISYSRCTSHFLETSRRGEWDALSLNYKASRHGRRGEPAVEWEYPGLVRIGCYGCGVDWALIGSIRCHEHIVRVWGADCEGGLLLSRVEEADHYGLAPVSSHRGC